MTDGLPPTPPRPRAARPRLPAAFALAVAAILLCGAAPVGSLIPAGDDLLRLGPTLRVAAIVAGTLISEDLTCISVGTLIHRHKLGWPLGVGACFLGIYLGDLLFFGLGRLGGAKLLRLRFFSRSLGAERLHEFGAWFDRRPWAAIMACRFLPGIRVPLYLSVGALTKRTKAFFWWTCFFAFVWTPLLILLVVLLGEAFVRPFEHVAHLVSPGTGGGWISILLSIAAIYLVVRLGILLSTAEGRSKLAGKFAWLRGNQGK